MCKMFIFNIFCVYNLIFDVPLEPRNLDLPARSCQVRWISWVWPSMQSNFVEFLKLPPSRWTGEGRRIPRHFARRLDHHPRDQRRPSTPALGVSAFSTFEMALSN
jgi:hypothetical protein